MTTKILKWESHWFDHNEAHGTAATVRLPDGSTIRRASGFHFVPKTYRDESSAQYAELVDFEKRVVRTKLREEFGDVVDES